MSNPIEELAARFVRACNESGESEQRVIERLKQRLHISRDTNRQFQETLTVGQKLADRIAVFGGSWTFILIFLSLLLGWIVLNTVLLARLGKPFDAYPYIFLNLILSMLAALQAPVIMMSQNRYAAKDRLAAEHDYEVNLKAELEILALHQKIDTLREHQWAELVAMQQEQIKLLTRLLDGAEVADATGRPSIDCGFRPAVAYGRALLARKLVIAGRRSGLTQVELARRAKIRVETLNRLEKGRHNPDERTFNKIEAVLRAEGVRV